MDPIFPPRADEELALYLLDLRSEYEAELRLLTEVQRGLERFRTARTASVRARAKEMLTQQMRLLDGANRSIHDVLSDAGPLLAALADSEPPSDGPLQ
jgi:hypothetical protein